MNFCGNIASIVMSLAIGIIVKEMGSCDLALVLIGLVALIGALSCLIIVGPLRRFKIGEPVPAPEAAPA